MRKLIVFVCLFACVGRSHGAVQPKLGATEVMKALDGRGTNTYLKFPTIANATASRVLVTDAQGIATNSATTATEVELLSGKTSVADNSITNGLGTDKISSDSGKGTNNTFRTPTISSATASRAAAIDAQGILTNSVVTMTEQALLSGKTSVADNTITNGLGTDKINIQSGTANALTSTNETVQTTASNTVPLIVNGRDMQRTNLQEWSTNGAVLSLIRSNGGLMLPNGSAALPSLTFANSALGGLFAVSAGVMAYSSGGEVWRVNSGSFSFGLLDLRWGIASSSQDLSLSRDGAGVAGWRFGAGIHNTNRTYASWTNASNGGGIELGSDGVRETSFIRSFQIGAWTQQPFSFGVGTNESIVLNTNHTITVRETINTMNAPTNTAAFLTDTNDIVPGQIYVGPAQRFSLSFDAYATATLAAGAICMLNYSNAAAGVIQTVGRFTIPSGILASDIMTNQLVLVNAEPNSMYWLTNATGGQPASMVTGSFKRTGN